MALTAEMVVQEALGLPTGQRALLAEKLLDSLAGETNPDVDRAWMDEVRKRRAAVRDGSATLIDGPEAVRQARTAIHE
jgi:hypothetical protein